LKFEAFPIFSLSDEVNTRLSKMHVGCVFQKWFSTKGWQQTPNNDTNPQLFAADQLYNGENDAK